MENLTFWQMLQIIGPSVGVYVAIRVDIAAMKIRVDHLERDLYKPASK